MATYRIYFTQTAFTSVEVEADDLEEAVEKAYEENDAYVCAECSGWGSRNGIDLSGVWERDATIYDVDGKFIEVPA